MSEWNTLIEPQPVRVRCIGCNALVKVETDGTAKRLAIHPIGGHRGVPFCSASGANL